MSNCPSTLPICRKNDTGTVVAYILVSDARNSQNNKQQTFINKPRTYFMYVRKKN